MNGAGEMAKGWFRKSEGKFPEIGTDEIIFGNDVSMYANPRPFVVANTSHPPLGQTCVSAPMNLGRTPLILQSP
ncbi:MAG: hypothetical protein Kow00107_10080 [Planctomycetota bacterium]